MWHGATAQTGQSLLVPRCTLERFERRKDTASLEGYRGECAVFPGENKSQTLPPLTFATVCIAMHWIADANGRDTLCRFDLELNAATIELGYLRSRDDLLADWRCRQMKQGLIALRAAFSMAMIMTGVANTGGKVASLKRLARCSAVTTSVNEPLGPTGTDAMRLFLGTCYAARTVHNEPCTAPPAKAAGCFPEENAPLIS